MACKPRARVRDPTIVGPRARAAALPYARPGHKRAVLIFARANARASASDLRSVRSRVWIGVQTLLANGLMWIRRQMATWRRRGDGVDGPGMSRAILTAQKHGQLEKRRLRLNVEGTSLAIWKCCNIIPKYLSNTAFKRSMNVNQRGPCRWPFDEP